MNAYSGVVVEGADPLDAKYLESTMVSLGGKS